MQRSGSETSSRKDSSQTAKSIPVQLLMSDPSISQDSPNVISSQVSEDGQAHYDSRVGPIIEKYGLAAVLANLSPSRASSVGLLTNDIYGPSGDISSHSDALQRYMESRLRQLLHGSDLCEVIWKPWTTPWGQCLSRPRARVRTTSETDSGLWRTATAEDSVDRIFARNSRGEPKLSAQAKTATWATPAARDWRSDRSQKSSEEIYGAKGRPLPWQVIEASPWPTPTSLAHAKNGNNEAGNSAGLVAIRKHAMAWTWPTPAAMEPDVEPDVEPEIVLARKERLSESTGVHRGPALPLGSMVKTSNGSSEPTEKPGALNPEFVCWLMGYPPEWLSCAPSEMPSTSGRPRRSSKQRCDQSQGYR